MASFSESSAASPDIDSRRDVDVVPIVESERPIDRSIGILGLMDPSSRSAAIYYRLPASMQNLVLHGGGLRQARIRFGRSFERRLESLKASDLWDASQIRAYQETQISGLIETAYRETVYYRRVMDERGLTPSDIRTPDDLRKMPILTKSDVRRHRDEMVTANSRRRKLHTIHTSGSTGPPMEILTPREGLAFKWAVWWRHRERFNMRRGMRYVSITSAPWVRSDQRSPPYWRWNRAEHKAFVPMQQIVPSKIADIVRFLDSNDFRYWAGYPSVLHSLVIAATEAGLSLSARPRAIFTGAEALFDHQRADLATFAGVQASQMYGFNEGAGNASECPAGSLHEDFEYGYMECVDPVVDDAAGTITGPIVATGFSNRAMPLIRYEVGDVGVWRPDDYSCPCGRQSRVLAAVDGRLEDYVVTPEGLRARRIGDIFKGMSSLKQFQIAQTRPERITMRLAVKPGFDQKDEDILRKRVGLWLSDSLKVRFEYVDSIAPGPTGKLERVVGTISEGKSTPPTASS